jgi:hypothetical protein
MTGRHRVHVAVERAEDELQGMILLPPVGIAAGRGGPVGQHEPGPFAGEPQLLAGSVEAELLGQVVDHPS